MKFAREAWPIVIPVAIIGSALIALNAVTQGILLGVIGFSAIVLAVGVLLFFRDPERYPPVNDNSVVSPADGVVVDAQVLMDGQRLIAVFLSVFDVHVNRSPYAGVVKDVKRTPGTYLHANSAAGIKGNERVEVLLETAHGLVSFTQLSGLVARKISCRITKGDVLKTGDRYGLIYFGSRMELILPATAKICVRNGDRVKAGETVVALFEI